MSQTRAINQISRLMQIILIFSVLLQFGQFGESSPLEVNEDCQLVALQCLEIGFAYNCSQKAMIGNFTLLPLSLQGEERTGLVIQFEVIRKFGNFSLQKIRIAESTESCELREDSGEITITCDADNNLNTIILEMDVGDSHVPECDNLKKNDTIVKADRFCIPPDFIGIRTYQFDWNAFTAYFLGFGVPILVLLVLGGSYMLFTWAQRMTVGLL